MCYIHVPFRSKIKILRVFFLSKFEKIVTKCREYVNIPEFLKLLIIYFKGFLLMTKYRNLEANFSKNIKKKNRNSF